MNIIKLIKSILLSIIILTLACLIIFPISAYFFGESLGTFLVGSLIQTSLLIYLIIKRKKSVCFEWTRTHKMDLRLKC